MLQQFDENICVKCPYYETKHLVPSLQHQPIATECHDSSTLLVFQSPGICEWTGNRNTCTPAPIISTNSHSTAARIRNAFTRTQKKRCDFDITEVVRCYPGKKRNSGRDATPDKLAISHCIELLKKDIITEYGSCRYKKIISFGKIANAAVEQILSQNNLSSVVHIILPHPSSGKLTNRDLDINL